MNYENTYVPHSITERETHHSINAGGKHISMKQFEKQAKYISKKTVLDQMRLKTTFQIAFY